MINSNKDCSQIDQLKAMLDKKLPELDNRKHIIFHQDKSRLHVSLMTRQKLLQLGWEVLIHPPLFIRHYTFGFPFISVFTEFS
jgi:histone-lysine N-methyltransferase SETMAR